MTTRLPLLLENLRIATPCRADWDDMAGDDRVRFCGQCDKNVYNLSAMTRGEAEALVREREGKLCVRLYQRGDGTVLTADCPVGVRRQRLRRRLWAAVSGAAASAALVLGLWCGRARADLTIGDGKDVPRPRRRTVMGAAAVLPPQQLMGKVAKPPEAKVAKPPEAKAAKPPEAKAAKPPEAKAAKPQPLMGEPAPITGEIALPPTR